VRIKRVAEHRGWRVGGVTLRPVRCWGCWRRWVDNDARHRSCGEYWGPATGIGVLERSCRKHFKCRSYSLFLMWSYWRSIAERFVGAKTTTSRSCGSPRSCQARRRNVETGTINHVVYYCHHNICKFSCSWIQTLMLLIDSSFHSHSHGDLRHECYRTYRRCGHYSSTYIRLHE